MRSFSARSSARPAVPTSPILVLLTVGLAASTTAAQYETAFSAVASANPGALGLAEQTNTGPASILDWYASGQDFWCQGWTANSYGTATASTPYLMVEHTARKTSGCATPSSARSRARITCDDLVFTDTNGGSGTTTVTLPAVIFIDAETGNPDNDDGMASLTFHADDIHTPNDLIPKSEWQATGTSEPDGFHDVSHTSEQPLDEVLAVTFTLECTTVVHHSDVIYNTIPNAAEVWLGDPQTGELFVLPPGITANAPSIGLVDNVLTEPWVDLGGESLGAAAAPKLAGQGLPAPGSPVTFLLTGAPPQSPTVLSASASPIPFAFAGGTYWGFPSIFNQGLVTDAAGQLSLTVSSWPALPPGARIYTQYVCLDSSSAIGLMLSNALRATSQ